MSTGAPSAVYFSSSLQGSGSISHVGDVALVCLRGVGVVALASLVALSLAFLTRRTIAVIGIVFGYLVARLVATAFSSTKFYGVMQAWLPETNVLAVMRGATSYTVYSEVMTSSGIDYRMDVHWVGWEHGLAYLAVGTVVVVAAAVLIFRRRDIG